MFPAIFLDRDGVIIENRSGYIRDWSDVEIYPQALKALANASRLSYKLVIVTNQAGIGHGLIPITIAREINRRLVSEIEKAGGRIDGVYMCPHKPEDQCDCRKPRPGMLLQAANDLSIDLSRSIMIGDAISDVEAGFAAGVGKIVMVRTGRGAEQAKLLDFTDIDPLPVYDSLYEALANLLPTG
jgi:D-glycero-D-manno-heptose 1,7-bisphosphate phosphatase